MYQAWLHACGRAATYRICECEQHGHKPKRNDEQDVEHQIREPAQCFVLIPQVLLLAKQRHEFQLFNVHVFVWQKKNSPFHRA
jgi:hypothetical protein